MKIAIPSYKRADSLVTLKWATGAIVVIPESQEEEYRQKNPEANIQTIPDKKDGNISKKRNAVLDLYPGEDVIMLDDDIKWVGYHEGGAHHKVDWEYFCLFAENMFQMCKEAGTIMWGVNLLIDPRMYREYCPFSFTNVVLGPFTAIRNIDPKIRYSVDLHMNEDYDMAIEVLRKYRKILRNNKWVYNCGHITTPGGLSSVRNYDLEMLQNSKLVKKWGSKIVDLERKTQGGNETINPKVRVPIKGV